jgi:uncharacterized protein (TIGR02246 family)
LAVAMVAGVSAAEAADGTNTPRNDEVQIRALLDRIAVAVKAKDIVSVMKAYLRSDELFVFNMGVPRHLSGSDALRQDWQDFFNQATRPNLEVEDLSITVVGKVAYSHAIMHSSWTKVDGTHKELMASVTDVYRKIDGKWLIVQDHWSIPINTATGTAEWMAKP